MTITICHNKTPDRKWDWSVDDVMPRSDGPENLRILKEKLSFLPLWRAVEFFGSLLADILSTTRSAARWGGVSIVWLA